MNEENNHWGAHTDPQIITQNGRPAFAVIPWDEYQELIRNQVEPDEADVWFPNEVVKANVRGESLIRAWREYFKLTRAELAAKAGMTQSDLARLENGDANPNKAELTKLAEAIGIDIEQLTD
ncbi:HTH domain-containing protein, Cro/C1-type [Desulfonema magnum]|uniref:HTH domain-containing protein, Cro/C1-type n=2 Tax=Desulfonema magnum TaxID=45655 RepID=A0A975GNN6_9BACT|nr:HTH domain-containing protein, Cro/C1-type [Desulfonema magnum]